MLKCKKEEYVKKTFDVELFLMLKLTVSCTVYGQDQRLQKGGKLEGPYLLDWTNFPSIRVETDKKNFLDWFYVISFII